MTADDEEWCCHNGGIVRKDGLNFLVPYDFDLAGFVNPRYARPDASLPIRRVTTRIYRGYCIKGIDIGAAIDAVLAREAALLATIADLPDADPERSGERLEYLRGFFEEARTGDLAAHFEANCVG